MRIPFLARASSRFLLGCLFLALVNSCLEPGREEVHYVSLDLTEIEDSLAMFPRVQILMTESGPGGDTLDVLWNDTLPEAGRLRKLKAKRYRGGDAVVIVAGYLGEALRLRRRIAYNSSSGQAVFMDEGRDSLPPVFTSRLPDSLTLSSWSQFPDSLVHCEDERDGVLRREIDTMPRDSRLPTLYTTLVYCRDLSRNSTWKKSDTVMVYLDPPRPPVLTLSGRDSVEIPVGGSADASASCRDSDGAELPVRVSGAVDSTTMGKYVITYSCTGAAGLSTSRKRVVWVAEVEDRDPPIVTLNGPDSVDHPLGTPYVDLGGTCVDRRDGPRPLLGGGNVDIHTPGLYTFEHKCRDLTGNTTYPVRKVRVLPFAIAPVRADAVIDSTLRSNVVNSGMTAVLAFYRRKPVADDHSSLLAFDLSGVRRDSLKSAKAVFQTIITGPFIAPLDSHPVVFQVHRVLSPWVEGTGNWYYNRGFFQNRGHVFLMHHTLSEEVRARSTIPLLRSGFTKEDLAIIRVSNMEEAGTDTVAVSYRLENCSNGHPGILPARKHFVQLEIDLTRYVKETPEGKDYGLVITTEGMPENLWINWVTKELGDGSMAPYLKLYY